MKRQGLFTNPTCKAAPAKLRLAFEAAPVALLIESAGGIADDGTGGSTSTYILDVEITAVDQRTGLCCGSAEEVRRYNSFFDTRMVKTSEKDSSSSTSISTTPSTPILPTASGTITVDSVDVDGERS